MSDFLDLQGAKDLNTDAIHLGAVANSVDPVTGAPIDTHVNRVGGVDYTLQGLWGDLGPVVMPWTSVAGGTLTQPNQAFLHPANGNYYSWGGNLPHVVAPGADPTLPGSGYVPRTDVMLRAALAGGDGAGLVGAMNYAGIRAYTGASAKIQCLGRVHAFDFAFGYFYLDESDTASNDDDGTILVDALGRRWKRQYSGAVNVIWYGAIPGDDTSDTAIKNRDAFRNATLSMKSDWNAWRIGKRSRSVYVPAGDYNLSNGFCVPKGCAVFSDGLGVARLKSLTATADTARAMHAAEMRGQDMQDMPERIWVTHEDHGASWSGSYRVFRASDLDHGEDYPEYTRTDLCITEAECQRRIDAAVLAEREACAWTSQSFLVGDPKNGIPLRSTMPSEISAAIRARGQK